MSECVYPQHLRMNWQGLNSEEEAENSRKNTAKHPHHHHRSQPREAREKRPVFQVQTARSKAASRSIDWALFSIQTEWRGNAIRIRVCRNVVNVCNSSKRPTLMQNMYPLSNQEKRPRVAEESPENPMLCSKCNTHTQGT